MFSTVAGIAKVAAPHIGKAVIAGGKATAFAAVALKAQNYALGNVSQVVDHFDNAGRAVRDTTKVDIKVAKTQERKAS